MRPRLVPGDLVWLRVGDAGDSGQPGEGGDADEAEGTAVGAPIGREQRGRRPAVVVASQPYLDLVDSLVIVVPVTSRDRGWPNHVPVPASGGLAHPSWAMTEQPQTLSRSRIERRVGSVDESALADIRIWLRDFLI